MGRIRELRQKLAKKDITDDEKAELNELEQEAAEESDPNKVGTGNGTDDNTQNTDDENEDEVIERMADKLVAKVTRGIEQATERQTPKVEVKSEAKFIVDTDLGRKSVDELSEIKVALPGRKGKNVSEVSMKTVKWAQALVQGDRQKLQLLTEGTAGAGGYLVPEEFANLIVEDKRDATIMRQIADSMTIQSDTLHLPTLGSRPQAAWRSEAAVKQTSTVTWGELVFTPYSLAAIVGLSQELADDASLGVGGSIVNYVARLMVRSLAEKEEQAFWTGNGSGKPTGVNNYSITGLDAGSTDAAFADAIKKLYFRLPQGYRNSASWVGNAEAWARVSTLKDTQGNYLLNRLGDTPAVTLWGKPVYEQNDLPGDVLFFGDFSYYMIVDRQGIQVDFSTEATVGGSSAFEKNLVFVRVEERVDGELTLTNAVRKITGLN